MRGWYLKGGGGGGGGGEDFLGNSLIWVGHNKMLLGVKNFQKMQFDPPLQLSHFPSSLISIYTYLHEIFLCQNKLKK